MNHCENQFAQDVHSGKPFGKSGRFKSVFLFAIDGSALGPQFVSQAFGHAATDKVGLYSRDSSDPHHTDNVLSHIGARFSETLTVVVSKSGGTKETRDGMLETQAAYKKANPRFAQRAVAVTSQDSELDKLAARQGWLQRFPLWDRVGGRTSELLGVGLLPAALQCLNIGSLLAQAKACDEVTRAQVVS